MIAPLRLLLFTCLACAIASVCRGANLRGIDPQLLQLYTSTDGQFTCLDGLKAIPLTAVNDDYCDCFDGSDEPGTSACLNGVFYCRNLGHEPLRLNSSFVDDGVCDCCDGSDELQGCTNRCKELGEGALQSLIADVAAAEAGMQAKAKYISEAAGVKQGWQQRLDEVQAELAEQQKLVDELRGKKEEAEEMQQQLEATKKEADEAACKKKEEEEAAAGAHASSRPLIVSNENVGGFGAAAAVEEGEPAWPLTGLEQVRALKKELSDKIDAGIAASLVAREAGVLARATEPEAAGDEAEGEKQESAEELANRVQAQWIPGSQKVEEGAQQRVEEDAADELVADDGEEVYTFPREEEEGEVAADWDQADSYEADHADEEEEGAADDSYNAAPPAATPQPPVAEPVAWLQLPPWAKKVMEWGMELHSQLIGKPLSPPETTPEATAPSVVPPVRSDASRRRLDQARMRPPAPGRHPNQRRPPKYPQRQQPHRARVADPKDTPELAEAKAKASEARDAYLEQEQKLKGLQSELSELQSYLDEEYGPDGEYAVLVKKCVETKIDKYTYQVCLFGEAAQKVGHSSTSLGNWEGFGEGLSSMKFTDGADCWQGPARSMEVSLHCGSAEELTHVAEPSRCEYHAQLATPAACSAQHLRELKDRLAAKQRLLEAVAPEEHDEL